MISKTEQIVLDALCEAPDGMTRVEIANVTGLELKPVSNALTNLHKSGQITRMFGGKWIAHIYAPEPEHPGAPGGWGTALPITPPEAKPTPPPAKPSQEPPPTQPELVAITLSTMPDYASAAEIAEACGLSIKQVSFALKRLFEKGLIEKTGTNRYIRYRLKTAAPAVANQSLTTQPEPTGKQPLQVEPTTPELTPEPTPLPTPTSKDHLQDNDDTTRSFDDQIPIYHIPHNAMFKVIRTVQEDLQQLRSDVQTLKYHVTGNHPNTEGWIDTLRHLQQLSALFRPEHADHLKQIHDHLEATIQ